MHLELFLPKYWATWVGLSVLRTIELLPFPAQRRVGSALGKLIRRLPLAYVRIARRNIQLCMPALSARDQADLVDRHCQSLGMGLCETANTWWSSDRRVHELAEIQGLENLQAALAKGRGAIMIGGHFFHHRNRHPHPRHRRTAQRGVSPDEKRAPVAHNVHQLLAPWQADRAR